MLTRRSRTVNTQNLWLALCATLLVLVAGCAHAAEPMRVSLAQVRQGAIADWRAEGPLIVELQAGDRLPVDIAFQSEFFAFTPPPGMELAVKAHCFVRFGADGIHTSPDGVDFETVEPGRFGIHLATTKTTPTRLRIDIVAPRHAK